MRNWIWVVTVLFYLSVAVAVLVTVVMIAGMAAYIAKTFFQIQPKWMFGLFD